MNMAEYGSQRSEQPENVNFEPIKRSLKIDILTETKCKICFIYVGVNCKRKKWCKKCLQPLLWVGEARGPLKDGTSPTEAELGT